MRNFRTLDLAKTFYKDCQSIKLKPPFKDQFDRALLSVVLNLAEGSAPEVRSRRCLPVPPDPEPRRQSLTAGLPDSLKVGAPLQPVAA